MERDMLSMGLHVFTAHVCVSISMCVYVEG